jgi:hypothetical protein
MAQKEKINFEKTTRTSEKTPEKMKLLKLPHFDKLHTKSNK